MPHNKDLTPKTHAFPNLIGQIPLTRVKDYAHSIKVDLVKHDDPVKMLDGTYDFVKATWSADGRESERASYEEKMHAMSQMLQGKALTLGLETVQFIFRISGITRLDTHQIVRQRVGVTFSQQCSGDQFWTHHDVLVEPSIWTLDRHSSHRFIISALEAKKTYMSLLNTGEVSVQAARSILPHCLDTFIFMRVDLATLLFFHQKRIDNGSQTWQMNEISQQMADEVCKVFPDLKETFEKNKTRFKFQREASKDRKNTLSTGLYLPEPDDFPYHERDFLYQRTKNEMHRVAEHKVAEIPTEYYWGTTQITREQYDTAHLLYEAVNNTISENHCNNAEALNINMQANIQISRLIMGEKK